MKIAVIADAHANLPALESALSAINAEGCDAIFHVGDAIAIGPFPAECVDLMVKTPNLKCVKGNHEMYFVNGLPQPQPEWITPGEVEHMYWTHTQLGQEMKTIISAWPMTIELVVEGLKLVFMHYGLTPASGEFSAVVRNPTGDDLDSVFRHQDGNFIFYGHDHAPSDIRGRARYINLGSLGCASWAVARYTIAEFRDGGVDIEHHATAYDDTDVFRTFEERDVPEREFIYKTFYGGRFGT